MTDQPETNRDRVRRLLLAPLAARGFRFPKGTTEAEGRAEHDAICDDFAYLTDASLATLEEAMRGKGAGTHRCLWPPRATFTGFAEQIQPRPVEELPALLSWFGSVEGPRAMAAGELVETFDYVTARKVPPATPQARALVSERASENNRRLTVIREKTEAGLAVTAEDREWARYYRARRAYCEELVAAERARRGHAA